MKTTPMKYVEPKPVTGSLYDDTPAKPTATNRQRWENDTKGRFTDAEFNKAKANYEEGKQRWPKEFAEVETMLKREGLDVHKDVIEHYLHTPSPIQLRDLTVLTMYPTPQNELLPPVGPNASPGEILYRKAL